MKPYTDKIINSNEWIRTFDVNTISEELVWHRDKKTRLVKILEGAEWELQLDNELPLKLEQNKIYIIPKMQYHRIIKGISRLVIQIKEV
jgi:hypothetical protein